MTPIGVFDAAMVLTMLATAALIVAAMLPERRDRGR